MLNKIFITISLYVSISFSFVPYIGYVGVGTTGLLFSDVRYVNHFDATIYNMSIRELLYKDGSGNIASIPFSISAITPVGQPIVESFEYTGYMQNKRVIQYYNLNESGVDYSLRLMVSLQYYLNCYDGRGYPTGRTIVDAAWVGGTPSSINGYDISCANCGWGPVLHMDYDIGGYPDYTHNAANAQIYGQLVSEPVKSYIYDFVMLEDELNNGDMWFKQKARFYTPYVNNPNYKQRFIDWIDDGGGRTNYISVCAYGGFSYIQGGCADSHYYYSNGNYKSETLLPDYVSYNAGRDQRANI